METKEKKESIIYGVRTGDTYHYIGKMAKVNANINTNGNLNNSDVKYQYFNDDIRNVFLKDDINVVVIKDVDNKWYDEKLEEVVAKHRNNNPLLNAQWMLDGKRGYWEDKTRDTHTLQRLSESKYVKVLEYNINGEFIKAWKSMKEVATVVIGDYKVVNGAGDTKLYGIMSSPFFKSRLCMGSYWFRESELQKYFNCIPKKMNLERIFEIQSQLKKERTKPRDKNFWQKSYTVIHYNPDGTIKAHYDNTKDAAYHLKTNMATIAKFCRGDYSDDNYILKYGEKTKQPIYREYPKYEQQPLDRAPKIKEPKPIIRKFKAKKQLKPIIRKIHEKKPPRQKTRSRTTIDWYVGGVVFRNFTDVIEAAEHFGVSTSTIRKNVVYGYRDKLNADLRKGKKIQIFI